jgi:hypothetical protein
MAKVASEFLGNRTWENTSLGSSVQVGHPGVSLFSKESLSDEFTVLHPGAYSGQFLRCPESIFPVVLVESSWNLFNDIIL